MLLNYERRRAVSVQMAPQSGRLLESGFLLSYRESLLFADS
jgi:hypothetical protein